jgi:hypothetical protein
VVSNGGKNTVEAVLKSVLLALAISLMGGSYLLILSSVCILILLDTKLIKPVRDIVQGKKGTHPLDESHGHSGVVILGRPSPRELSVLSKPRTKTTGQRLAAALRRLLRIKPKSIMRK